MRLAVLNAARNGGHGLRVLTFEQVAARLAGGFVCPVDNDALLSAVRDALRKAEWVVYAKKPFG
jgi:hypothetical protein